MNPKYRNVLKNNDSKFRLIGKINGLSNEVKRARRKIFSTDNVTRRCRAAYRKRILGVDVRHHLLAYAFLRGKPYSQIERSCREDNKPSVELIVRAAIAHDSFYSISALVKPENVAAWLKGEF